MFCRPEIFEEYTRGQYLSKAPSRNPFGDEDAPKKFYELDVFERVRVLQQLSVWTFGNPEKIRERMAEQKEMEQTQWVCWSLVSLDLRRLEVLITWI